MEHVSIIIPVYNHQAALLRALDSVRAQTYKEIEVIIVDDGSEPPIVLPAMYMDESYPVTLLRKKNEGAPSARNWGYEHAKGEYCMFWDADIEAAPDMIETMVHALHDNMDVAFVYCNHTVHTLCGIQKKMRAQLFSLSALKENNYIHSTSLIRKSNLVPRWDESLQRFQDWDFFLHLATRGGKGMWIDKILFAITTKGTMSTWLPRCAYHAPLKWFPWVKKQVRTYHTQKEIVQKKYRE